MPDRESLRFLKNSDGIIKHNQETYNMYECDTKVSVYRLIFVVL